MKDIVMGIAIAMQFGLACYALSVFYHKVLEIQAGNISTVQPYTGQILFER